MSSNTSRRTVVAALIASFILSLSARLSAGDDCRIMPAVLANAAPKIDGRLDDEVWKAAPEAGEFVLLGRDVLARAQTTCRALWDAERLYLGIRCAESALIAAAQKDHLLQKQQTKRDGNVFSDDCIEVFLAPSGRRTYYHLAVTAGGTCYDAERTDNSWNADWNSAVHLGEGFWSVELSIPFGALKQGVKDGDAWGFNVCRERKPVKELSTLSQLDSAFHEPGNFAVLRFCKRLPRILDHALVLTDEGRLRASVETSHVAGVQKLSVAVEQEGSDGKLSRGKSIALGQGESPVRKDLSDTPAGECARLVLLGSDGATVLAGRWLSLKGAGTRLPVRMVLKDCRAELIVNGRSVSLKQDGTTRTGVIRLNRGLNVLGVRAVAVGPAPGLSVDAPEIGFPLEEGWIVRSSASGDWLAPEPKASGWQPALRTGCGMWLKGDSEGLAVFRRGIFVPEPGPTNFPQVSDFYVPLHSAQLVYPQLPVCASMPSEGNVVDVDMPDALRLEAIDASMGCPGQMISSRRDLDTGRMHYRIRLPSFCGQGMELNARWVDATDMTAAYVPALNVCGTGDWKRVRGTLRSPAEARKLHLLLIKWQKRGIVGEAWFDNLAVRRKGSEEELLKIGSFEEEHWKENRNWHLVKVERKGQQTTACRISGTAEKVERQDAMWVGEPFPVEPGADYEFEADVKLNGVHSLTAKPRLVLLVRLTDPRFKTGSIRYRISSPHGRITSICRSIDVHALPPLADKRPKRSRIIPCYYSDMYESEAVNRAIADNVKRSGIRGLYGRAGNRVARAVAGDGFWLIWSFPYHGWQTSPAPDWPEKHPERLSVDFQGKRETHRVCPTYALESGNEFLPLLDKWIGELLVDCPYDEINSDYEVPVVQPPTFCFCDRCLKAFAEFRKLPEGTSLDAKTVLERYADEWTEFRCRQNAELMAKLSEFIHKREPDIPFSVYSGYQREYTRKHYGVDWGLMAPHLDNAIAGYGGSRQLLEATQEALGEVPFIGGEMYYLSPRSDERGKLRRRGWKLRLLRCYVNGGCNGVLIWYLPTMDGWAFYETSLANAVIADFEDFFRKGERVDAEVAFKEEVRAEDFVAFRLGGKTLILVFNPSDEARTVTLKGPGACRRYDYSRLALTDKSPPGTSVRIAPWDAAVLLVEQE